MTFIYDIKGSDGLTDRERNSLEVHNIQLGSLVEVEGELTRQFVVHLGRDCDGTPLYWLSVDPLVLVYDGDIYENGLMRYTLRGKVLGGYAEESLNVIKPPSHVHSVLREDGWVNVHGEWIEKPPL